MIPSLNKLHVHTIEQKIIFHCEMHGQISDGMWENYRVRDHWVPWSRLSWNDVVVSKELEGRTFYAPFDKYNFADPKLLRIVGERIAYKVRLFHMFPSIICPILAEDHWLIPDSLEEIKMLVTPTKYMSTWFAERVQKLNDNKVNLQMLMDAWWSKSYGKQELLKDCKQLKVACRTKIW